jgi:hypothetical protein
LLDKRLQGVDLAVILPLDKLDLSESTLANDLQGREVLWLLLGSQESQIFDLGTTIAVLLLNLPVIRDGRLLHNRL